MSWRDRSLAVVSRAVVKQVLRLPLPWSVHRNAFRLIAPRLPLQGIFYEATQIAGVSCGIVAPDDARGTLLWLHGGGFVIGSDRGYLGFAAALARSTGLRIVLPNYRLAPENPFPAAPDDCLAVARAVAALCPFALGGDSAGGCLAAVTLSALLKEGTPPTQLVLLSPAVDLDPDRRVPEGARDLIFPPSILARAGKAYLGDADPKDPRVSPVRADFPGAPPTLIQCARRELLEEDTDAIADRLRAQGAQVVIQKTTGVPHGWQLFVGRTPEADRAVVRIAEFLGTAP